MKPLLVALFLLFGAARADEQQLHASNEWTWTDTTLQVTLGALLLVDSFQTVWIRQHGFLEANVLLGLEPSVSSIFRYTAAVLVLHTAIALVLPQPYRLAWQCIFLGIELGAVGYNVEVGVGLSVPW